MDLSSELCNPYERLRDVLRVEEKRIGSAFVHYALKVADLIDLGMVQLLLEVGGRKKTFVVLIFFLKRSLLQFLLSWQNSLLLMLLLFLDCGTTCLRRLRVCSNDFRMFFWCCKWMTTN